MTSILRASERTGASICPADRHLNSAQVNIRLSSHVKLLILTYLDEKPYLRSDVLWIFLSD